MTFLAPWAFVAGLVGAAGIVLLHLVSRHRPAAFVLPTTRFIPDQQTLVSKAATHPSDLLLLLVRVVLLLAAATAFARPVIKPSGGSIAQVILVDRSSIVGNPADATARLKTLLAAGGTSRVIAFDTSARRVDGTNIDSATVKSGALGSISPALLLARRVGVELAEQVDSVRLVIVSPIAASEIDSATRTLRAMWPGSIRIEQVAPRVEHASAWGVERALPLSDVLGPALVGHAAGALASTSRVVRSAVSAEDSAFARTSGTVVRWDTSAASPKPEGLSAGGDVIVASLARRDVGSAGHVVARWADGTAAAVESTVGAGCIRDVGVGVPHAGDLPLHPPFQQIVRRLVAPCNSVREIAPADSATIAMLRGGSERAAASHDLVTEQHRTSVLVQVLLGVALLCALGELAIRMVVRRPDVAT